MLTRKRDVQGFSANFPLVLRDEEHLWPSFTHLDNVPIAALR
jgi:hypothetical protein